MVNTNPVLYSRDERVAFITLNQPEKLNALSPELLEAFDRAVDEFEDDGNARVAVIRGEGRAFCGGYAVGGSGTPADLTEDRHQIRARIERWLRLWEMPKPFIAQVHGYCLGGGSDIPIFCDLATVAEDAQFGFPRLPLGGGEGAPMWAWAIGAKKAKELAFCSGRLMSGKEAYHFGYANLLFRAEDLAEGTLALARDVAKAPADLLEINKLSVNRIVDVQGFRTSVLFAAEWSAIAHKSPSAQVMKGWIRELGLKEAIARYNRDGV